MKVDSLEFFPIRISGKERLTAGTFSYEGYVTVLIRAICDGEEGWGEAMTRTSPTVTSMAVKEILAPDIIGCEVEHPSELWGKIWRKLRARGHTRGIEVEALSGIDIALWDAYCKMKKVSLGEELSKHPSDAIQAYAGSVFPSRGDIMSQVKRVQDHGLSGVKIKIGFGLENDTRLVRQVRKYFPSGMVIIDANGAYSADEAIALGEMLEGLQITWFEEPVLSDDIEGYRKIKGKMKMKIAAGETWFGSDFDLPIREGLVQIVEPCVSRCGGITLFKDISKKVEYYGLKMAPMVGLNSAITLAASLHLACASRSSIAIEFDPFGNPLVNELCHNFPVLKDGKIIRPKKYGLGVEIDESFLARAQRDSNI